VFTPGAKLVAAWAMLLVLPNTGSTFRYRDTPEATRIDRVEPASARPGDVVLIYGRGLERSKIADVLLTDGGYSVLTRILDQGVTSIRVQLPRMRERLLLDCAGYARPRDTTSGSGGHHQGGVGEISRLNRGGPC